MKNFLATTALALVVANGAFAESHVAADGTVTDSTMEPADDTMAPADDTMAPADGTIVPADEAAPADTTMEPADSTAPADATMEPADGAEPVDSTATDMTAETDPAEAATSSKDGYDTVMNADVTAEELTGAKVFGTDDEGVGEIGDLVVGADGSITEVIVDVGGFLGLGEKPVAIAYDQVEIMKQIDGDTLQAYVPMTEDQLKELPKYEAPAN